MKIVSFNLRNQWDSNDGLNNFISRAVGVLYKIEEEQPELLCFQEATEQNVTFLRKYLKGYNILFNQRDADLRGEGLAIAYRWDMLELFNLNVYWLSPEPNVPGSRFEDQSECPRICQTAVFRTQKNRLIRICNIHLDYISAKARILAIRQLMDELKSSDGEQSLPVFLMGDFNAEPDSETVNYCDKYKEFRMLDLTRGTGGTFHDFGRLKNPIKIDYIYADSVTAQLPHDVILWKDSSNGRFLSDHYPVCLMIELN